MTAHQDNSRIDEDSPMNARRKPGREPSFLNIRQQLEYAAMLLESVQKYGDCPLIRNEIPKFLLINRAILRKHDDKRKMGDRKDLRIEASTGV